MAVAIVAISLFVYGCKQSAQATSAPATPAAPEATTPAATEPADISDSDLTINQGVDESNPADLPEPSAP